MKAIPPRKYVAREMVCTRVECGKTVTVRVARPDKWRYCPDCLVIATTERKARARLKAAQGNRPRLVRFAGHE